VRTNFGHEFHIPKQDKLFISACDWKHLICELLIAERILRRHQQQFSINVWAGIVGACLVGPHVLPHRLTGKHYRDFLLHDLPKLLGVVPVTVRARMWYIHDGLPAHFSRTVRDVLNNTYRDQWRRTHCMASTHARFESSRFLPVGALITLVYATHVDNKEALHHHIVDVYQTIRLYPGIFGRMRRSVMRRVEACIESHGGKFEQLL
jgi:hypothetical protein